MQVAHYSYTLNMADPNELNRLIEKVKPNLIVPEIEAIATEVLVEIENKPLQRLFLLLKQLISP
jgi:phosphoribosylglycinamide formyltransferase 2